jgi:RNA recognition motif-containing protein
MAGKLYVGGLSYDTVDAELRTFFEQVGTVQSASVVTDRDSGRSKGFGFVEMSTDAETRQAVSDLNGKSLGGRTIRVEESRPSSRPGGSGSGSRGSGGGRW